MKSLSEPNTSSSNPLVSSPSNLSDQAGSLNHGPALQDIADDGGKGNGGDGKDSVKPPDGSSSLLQSDHGLTLQDGGRTFQVGNLLPEEIKVNHVGELRAAAKMLDQIRAETGPIERENAKLAALKVKISLAQSIDEMVTTLGTEEEGLAAMSRFVQERLLEEMLTLGTGDERIVLSEWPNSQKSNFFCEVIKLAHHKSPMTLSFLLRLLIKDDSSNIEPSHVVSIATLFSQLAYMVDRSHNTLLKINAMQLKLDGLTDEGLVAQEKIGLAVTARTIRHAREEFGELAECCLIEETKKRPDQATLDNCDQRRGGVESHTTVEYREIEYIDTSHLGLDSMGIEEIEKLFSNDILLLGSEELRVEREHVEGVILNQVVKVLADALPDMLGHWNPHVSKHHRHPYSHLPPREASIMLRPPHYLQVGLIIHFKTRLGHNSLRKPRSTRWCS